MNGADHPELVFYPSPPVHVFTYCVLALAGATAGTIALWHPQTAPFGGGHLVSWAGAALLVAMAFYATWRMSLQRAYVVSRLSVWEQNRILARWPVSNAFVVDLRDAEFREERPERLISQLSNGDFDFDHRPLFYLKITLKYDGNRVLFANHIIEEDRWRALQQLWNYARETATPGGGAEA